MTPSELVSAREAAGARYAAALTELRAALIDLAALDRAFGNPNANPSAPQHVPTFATIRDNAGDLSHPIFAPGPIGNRWSDDVRAAAENYVNSMRG